MSKTAVAAALSVSIVAASICPASAEPLNEVQENIVDVGAEASEHESEFTECSEDDFIASNPDEDTIECEVIERFGEDGIAIETGNELLLGEGVDTNSDLLYDDTEEMSVEPVFEDEMDTVSDKEGDSPVEEAEELSVEENFSGEDRHTWVIIEAVPASCTTAGHTASVICADCEAVYIPQKNIPPLGHSWSKWTVTKTATSEAEGEETRRCMHCGKEEIRRLPKLKE